MEPDVSLVLLMHRSDKHKSVDWLDLRSPVPLPETPEANSYVRIHKSSVFGLHNLLFMGTASFFGKSFLASL